MAKYIKIFLFLQNIFIISLHAPGTMQNVDATLKAQHNSPNIYENQAAQSQAESVEILNLKTHHETIQDIFNELCLKPTEPESLSGTLFLNFLTLISKYQINKNEKYHNICVIMKKMQHILNYLEKHIHINKEDTLFKILKEILYEIDCPIKPFQIASVYANAKNIQQKFTIINFMQMNLLIYIFPEFQAIQSQMNNLTQTGLKIIENDEILQKNEIEKTYILFKQLITAGQKNNLLNNIYLQPLQSIDKIYNLLTARQLEINNSTITIKEHKHINDDLIIENELYANKKLLAQNINTNHGFVSLFSLMLFNTNLQFMEMLTITGKENISSTYDTLQGMGILIGIIAITSSGISAILAALSYPTTITLTITFTALGLYFITNTFTFITNYKKAANILNKIPILKQMIGK